MGGGTVEGEHCVLRTRMLGGTDALEREVVIVSKSHGRDRNVNIGCHKDCIVWKGGTSQRC